MTLRFDAIFSYISPVLECFHSSSPVHFGIVLEARGR